MVGHEIGHDQTDREINFIQFLLFLNQIRNVVRNGIQELLFALYFSICCADSNNPHEEPVAVHNCGGLFYLALGIYKRTQLEHAATSHVVHGVNLKMQAPRN